MFKSKILGLFAVIAMGLFLGCSDNGNSDGSGQGEDNVGGGGSGSSETTTVNGVEFVLVRAGTFTMGDESYNSSSYYREHQVTLTNDYYISKYPITNAQYGKDVEGKSNHPIVSVSWYQASEWAESKGWRLPTEAEWEFAARGGNNSKGYIYSGSNDIDEVGWYISNSVSTHPVGQKKANELGIYDMSGNVWEWCSDWYGTYHTESVTNPTGPESGNDRVIRGGSWRISAEGCRVAFRGDDGPSSGRVSLGFRVVFNSD